MEKNKSTYNVESTLKFSSKFELLFVGNLLAFNFVFYNTRTKEIIIM